MKIRLLVLLFAFSPAAAWAQSSDYKAQFILKTLEFMKWNGAKGDGDIVIAVAGDAAFEKVMTRFTAGVQVRGKNVLLMPFKVEDLGLYHLVYVASAGSRQMNDIMKGAASAHTVVITHDEGALTEGAFVKLIPAGDKFRFTVDESRFSDADVLVSPVFQRLASRGNP